MTISILHVFLCPAQSGKCVDLLCRQTRDHVRKFLQPYSCDRRTRRGERMSTRRCCCRGRVCPAITAVGCPAVILSCFQISAYRLFVCCCTRWCRHRRWRFRCAELFGHIFSFYMSVLVQAGLLPAISLAFLAFQSTPPPLMFRFCSQGETRAPYSQASVALV